MDDTELHFLTYDPEEIWNAMIDAYVEAGGDLLYPGDEKEILLRAVQQVITLAFAGIDNALRMATWRYATREYLEVFGENRFCPIIEAQAARATVEIVFRASGTARTISAGTGLTADGVTIYQLAEDLEDTGIAQTVRAEVVCAQTGSAGNGLAAGAQMQFVTAQETATSVVCVTAASGGRDREEEEAYRERIRTHGLAGVTTGPELQYEAAAKAASSDVVDAHAKNLGGGQVGMYILPASGATVASLLTTVSEALSAKSVRPMNDQVIVSAATPIPYTLNVLYESDGSASTLAAIAAAAVEYQDWQDRTLGRAFNPDKLKALLYQAGATLVTWGSGSAFNGGSVERTEINENQYCSGTISLAVMDG